MWDLFNQYNKRSFIRRLPRNATVLDVGCASGSPAFTKSIRPDVHYVGLDVSDSIHPLSPSNTADEYRLVLAADFAAEIEKMAGRFDAVISSHNIEHCNEPERVLRAMAAALKPGALLYLSYPSDASLTLPSRRGCLNFFDDPTHLRRLDYADLTKQLQENGVTIEVSIPRHRPLIPLGLGLLLEPLSRLRNHVLRGTWALYGFESIIWARKTISVT